MRARIGFAALVLVMYATAAAAQDSVSLRPGFKAGDESRYTVRASVETTITPKGSDGIGGSSSRELSATFVLRTLGVSKEAEINQEAVVEAISINSGDAGAVSPPGTKEIAGKKIVFATDASGLLLRCSIPDSPGYLALADLVFSMTRWYPAGEVVVGGSWEAGGQGHMYTDKLSRIPTGATTVYKLDSLTKGLASIEGAVTLNQSGSSSLNVGGAPLHIGVVASGKGTAHVDVDVSNGRVINGATESRVEGSLLNIQPTAAGEKMHPREGSVVEISKFSIKLIK